MRRRNKIRKIARYTVSAAVAVVLMYFSFRGVNWSEFVASLQACNLSYIGISMAAGIVAFWLRGLRWRELLLPIDRKTTRLTTFNAINIGYIANFVFPRIGEFVRCGVITKNSEKASYDKVLGTVVLERSWDVLTMLTILIVFLLFKWQEFGRFFIDKMWLPIQQSTNFSLWWLLLILVILAVASVWVIVATKENFDISRKVCNVFSGLLTGLSTCLKMKRKWKFFLDTILIWLMYWIMSYSTMRAISTFDSLGAVDAFFLMLAGSFGWIVPVPGGFGAFHFIVATALLTVYGLPFETGIIFATLSHESQAITMVLCGGLSYLYEFILHPKPQKTSDC